MKTLKLLFFIPTILLISDCKKNLPTESLPSGDVVYFNSFEGTQDTVGWYGISLSQFRQDAPPGGGSHSVYIAGGCMMPHAWIESISVDQDCYLTIRCWGKTVVAAGGVLLQVKDANSSGIGVSIRDSVWTFYEASGKLFVPAHARLVLSMNSGGYAPGGMLVDVVEVVNVE